MNERRLVDRSRFIAYQRCPRSRYLEYELGGTGIRKIRANIPLSVGSHTHRGLALLCEGEDVELAVRVAIAGYDAEVKSRGLELEPGEDIAFVADECKALIEGLLRVYHLRGLPRLLEQFEVIEVEREDLIHDFAPSIDWMSRADGLLRERDSGDLYVLSFKTAATWDSRIDRQNQHDIQGLSEVAAIEDRIHEKIMGVKMIYLVKGRREEYPEDSGNWRTSSPLLRGWSRPGITSEELAWRYKWAGPDTWPDSGKLKGHTLGKGWTRFDTFGAEAYIPVKEWIEMMASGNVQPDAGDPFDGLIVEPMPYFRQQQDMDDWRQQAAEQERQIAMYVKGIEGTSGGVDIRRGLNAFFPQHRHSCDYPSRCQFQEICFGDDTMLTNPIGSGLYQIREPHHAPESAARK